MAAKVDIISKEFIKPSVPTPPTLRTHKLSLLDQVSPPVFIPLIFLYQYEVVGDNIMNHTKKIQLLKKSLSDVLTRFYPLAGRLNGNNSINCNDAGVEFIAAQVHGYNLSQVIKTPKMEELIELIPTKVCAIIRNDILMAVKASLFDCGGIAMGVCMSHKVGDGLSMVMFMNAWAAIARGDTNIVQPDFNLASRLFPPMWLLRFIKPTLGTTSKKLITRRFVFSKEELDTFKKASTSQGSRVETLSAILWKHLIELKKESSNKKKTFAAIHAVNIRSRMEPTLSDQSFGNLWSSSLALSNPESDDLLYQLASSIRKINSEYISKKLFNRVDFFKHVGRLLKLYLLGKEYCTFSSWRNFPLYEVDFGWGKPAWVSTTSMPYNNLIIFVSTKCGEGIEAWVNNLEDDKLPHNFIQSLRHML